MRRKARRHSPNHDRRARHNRAAARFLLRHQTAAIVFNGGSGCRLTNLGNRSPLDRIDPLNVAGARVCHNAVRMLDVNVKLEPVERRKVRWPLHILRPTNDGERRVEDDERIIGERRKQPLAVRRQPNRLDRCVHMLDVLALLQLAVAGARERPFLETRVCGADERGERRRDGDSHFSRMNVRKCAR